MKLRLTTPRRKTWAAALLASGAALAAQAQSAYTLTTLGKPQGSTSHAPTALATDGTVRGGMYYFVSVVFNPMENCYFCSVYQLREVSWGSGTGASVAATLGARNFFGLFANDKGTQVGASTVDTKSRAPNPSLVPNFYSETPAMNYTNRVYYLADTGINRNGTVTRLVPSPDYESSTPSGINNSDTIVGNSWPHASPSGWVHRQGSMKPLPTGPHPRATTAGINDQGTIVGSVMPDANVWRWRPALWVNDQLTRVGGPETADLAPVAINNAEQVLLNHWIDNPRRVTESLLWFNGVLTKIVDPQGRYVVATALNNAGTVVGCVQVDPPQGTVTSRADSTAFIWRNGVMQDLAQVIAAKGVKLPTGTRLGCPMAINQAGTILTYYYKPATQDDVTWIRLNAKP